MPVRFTSPSLGGQGQQFLEAHHWQLGAAFRRLYADQWFVGKDLREDLAPFGHPLFLNINSLDLTVAYGVTSRLSLAFTLPFSHGTHSRFYADNARHRVGAAGVGDISLLGTLWVRDPVGHAEGNVAVSLGVKAPTGNNRASDRFYNATDTTWFPVDQSIQLGDGGWGIMLGLQAFQRVANGLFAYAAANYLVSPRQKTDVPFYSSGVFLSVPDVYSARTGLAYGLWTGQGLSVSLGARYDGIPTHDVIGGRDDGFRRPGYTVYAEPGLSVTRRFGTFTLSVPMRLAQDFKPDPSAARGNGGDLASHLIFAGFTRNF